MVRNRTAALAIATAFLPVCLPADSLTLRNGSVIEGNFLGGTAREIRLEVGDRIQTFPVDTVFGIQFGNSGARSQHEDAANRAPNSRQESVHSSSTSSPSNYPPAGSGNLELPSGTQLTVRMIDTVDSESTHMGDIFRASIDEPVMVNGETVIPRGAEVVARLTEDQKSGKIQGRTVLKLILTSVNVNGRPVDISTQDLIKESSSRGARSAKVIGGTTALGAIIGGIAGGGKGAAIGAGSGAAVGTGAQEVGHGQRVRIPSETRLVFTLASNVRL